jgi:hypothetical protein
VKKAKMDGWHLAQSLNDVRAPHLCRDGRRYDLGAGSLKQLKWGTLHNRGAASNARLIIGCFSMH